MPAVFVRANSYIYSHCPVCPYTLWDRLTQPGPLRWDTAKPASFSNPCALSTMLWSNSPARALPPPAWKILCRSWKKSGRRDYNLSRDSRKDRAKKPNTSSGLTINVTDVNEKLREFRYLDKQSAGEESVWFVQKETLPNKPFWVLQTRFEVLLAK